MLIISKKRPLRGVFFISLHCQSQKNPSRDMINVRGDCVIFIQLFIITFFVFFLIDLLWLGIIAKNLYNKFLGHLLKDNVNWIAAIVFYLIFIVGLVFFVLMPAVEQDSFWFAFLVGGLFGFITYATYDLTNLATLKSWPIKITLIDLGWGMSLGAFTSLISYTIYTLIF